VLKPLPAVVTVDGMRRVLFKHNGITGVTLGMSVLFVLVALTPTHAGTVQQTLVYVSPATYTVSDVGSSFSVNISIQNVTNLYGWEFKLYYPNGVLNGTAVTEGAFLKSGGVNTFFIVADFTDGYNATQGLASLACLRITPDMTGVDGNGVLATITFNTTSNAGPESLHLADVNLSDPNVTKIPYIKVDGEVTVLPEFSTTSILLVTMMMTLAIVVLRKKNVDHKRVFRTA